MTNYKMCAVPMCGSTTIKYPEKLFIHVPKCPKRRKQWLQLARRDPKCTSDKSTIFFCEDHFDLPNDMENYIKYVVMGSVRQIKMKPDCLPSRFLCQPDRIKHTAPLQPRSAASKRQHINIIQQLVSEENEIPATSGIRGNNVFIASEKDDGLNSVQATQACPEMRSKFVQIISASKNSHKMENYVEYTTMGGVSRIMMRSGCLSTKFACQHKRDSNSTTAEIRRPAPTKRQRLALTNECAKLNTVKELILDTTANLDTSIECCQCHREINGFRYVCVQCADWDMCGRCEARGLHAVHYVLRVPAPRPQHELNSLLETIRNQLKALLTGVSEFQTTLLNGSDPDYGEEIKQEQADPDNNVYIGHKHIADHDYVMDIKQEQPGYSLDEDFLDSQSTRLSEDQIVANEQEIPYMDIDQPQDFYTKMDPLDLDEKQSVSSNEPIQEEHVESCSNDEIVLKIENQEREDIPSKRRKAIVPDCNLGHIVQCIKIIRKK